MAKNQMHRICADCKHWKCYDVVDRHRLEDEIGKCKITDETVFGDDDFAENCSDFKSGKRQAKKRR